jgi:hypothetical protein
MITPFLRESVAMPVTSMVRCRRIDQTDIDAVVELLHRGFPYRSRAYWRQGFERFAGHSSPGGLPRFGYVLESGDHLEGVVLTIFSKRRSKGLQVTLCNLSSWYVTPAFRAYAALLNASATRHKDVIYFNISPAAHTVSTIEAAGFSRYSSGQFLALPAFAPPCTEGEVRITGPFDPPMAGMDGAECDLLREHARLGCIVLWCATPRRAVPLVFLPRLIKGVLPCAQLVYCRGIDDFVSVARPVGRYLMRRGRPLVIVDTNGPVAGLCGRFFPSKSVRYYKGSEPPGLSDLAYTEVVFFGL